MTGTKRPPERATLGTRVLAWVAAVSLAVGATIGLSAVKTVCVFALMPDRSDRLGELRQAAFDVAAIGALAAAVLLVTGAILAGIAARRLAGSFDPVCTTNVGWVGGALAALAVVATLIAAGSGIASEHATTGLAAGLVTALAPVIGAAFAFVTVWRLRQDGNPLAQVLTRALVVACAFHWDVGGAFLLYWFVCAARDEPLLASERPSSVAVAAA